MRDQKKEAQEKDFARHDQPQLRAGESDPRDDHRGVSRMRANYHDAEFPDAGPPPSPVETPEPSHADTCAIHTCRWCDTDETTHAALHPACEFSPLACNCEVDYAAARARTPSGGYTVAEWMDEMDAQHTTMTAVMRELLAELRRCHEEGVEFDFLSNVVTRAYDTVGVIRVTPADLELLGSDTQASPENSETTHRSAAQ